MKKVTLFHHGNEFVMHLSQGDGDRLRERLVALIMNPDTASMVVEADGGVIIIPREVAINSIIEFSKTEDEI